MAITGTYSFDPTLAELIDEACDRVGVDNAELTERHIKSAIRSAQLLFVSWSNKSNPQWAIEENQQTLTQGVNQYTMPTGAISISTILLRTQSGTQNYDTEVFPISRSDYANIADKTMQGRPTQYFLDKERDAPVIKLWNTPENSTDILVYNYVRRIQDAGELSNTLDLPYRWFEAMAAGLAERLYPKMYSLGSGKYSQSFHQGLKGDAKQAFDEASWEERSKAPLRITVKYNGRGRR